MRRAVGLEKKEDLSERSDSAMLMTFAGAQWRASCGPWWDGNGSGEGSGDFYLVEVVGEPVLRGIDGRTTSTCELAESCGW